MSPHTQDVYSLTLHLTNVYPEADEFDLKDIAEELLNKRIETEDFQSLRAAYTKVAISRAEFE